MTGSYLLRLLLQDGYFSTVRVLTRRPLEKTDPKMEIRIVDFNDPESFKLALEGTDAVFCCIGTTQKNVKGNIDLYRKIDFDIPLKAARFSKEAGCESFAIITSVGATPRSRTFYLKLKGELEEAIRAIHINSTNVFQPSMLLGRRNEKRTGERVFQGIMRLFSPVMGGSMRKYKAIHGKTVAMAMLNAVKKNEQGFFKYTFDDIISLAKTTH